MKKIFLAVTVLVSLAFACSSDFECSHGQKCVKAPYSYSGACMNVVNEYGQKTYDYTPKADSIGTRTNADCNYDIDCGIGFKCDGKYKVCVKR